MSEDVFKTMSGRDIKLKIFSEEKNIATGKVDWAMASLKKAMAWDEEVYGLEYDLDVFHIVAVSSFNMVRAPLPPRGHCGLHSSRAPRMAVFLKPDGRDMQAVRVCLDAGSDGEQGPQHLQFKAS